MDIYQRVEVRTGERGMVVGQPDSDPIVLLDGHDRPEVFYRSEVRAT